MAQEEQKKKKPVDKNKFHKDYLAWKKESKGGKKRYYINNVLVSGLASTAVFALALCFINICVPNRALTWSQILMYVGIFLVVYMLLLFGIYYFSWQRCVKRFDAYEKALMALAAKKRDQQEDGELTPEELPDSAEQPAEEEALPEEPEQQEEK